MNVLIRAWSVLFLWLPLVAFSVPVTFQFQGHILIDGQAVEGSGNFKFSILRHAGTQNEGVVWSNDNPVGTPGEPSASVALTLRRGVYSIALGNDALPGMAPIPPAVFSEDNLSLRIWFSQGQGAFAQLAPDTQIGSVAFAMRAATVDRVEEAALPDSVGRIIALTDKMTFSSQNERDADLIGAGYSVFRELEAVPWVSGPTGEPSARVGHTGVWTGREFIVWGGGAGGSNLLGTGGVYDQLTGEWTTVASTGAPVARRVHRAVWTGDRMIIWGGHNGDSWDPRGGQYEPRIRRWFPMAASPVFAREDHVMLWTGTRMLIWGGRHGQGFLADGAVYDPVGNQWTPVPTAGAPTGRAGATGIWSGEEVLIWGGKTTRFEVGDGARLIVPDQGPAQWRPLSSVNAPSGRQGHTAIWTGTQMIVWGGVSSNELLDDGGVYHPQTDTWSPISRVNAPSARSEHSAVWTGKEMVILFGVDQNGETASAHAYSPTADQWRALPNSGDPIARSGAAVVWTGREILAFGGEAQRRVLGSLQILDPEPPVYLYRKP